MLILMSRCNLTVYILRVIWYTIVFSVLTFCAGDRPDNIELMDKSGMTDVIIHVKRHRLRLI